MDIENLIGEMVLGSLGGRRKRSKRAARFLAGGRGSFVNASTLLTLGGLAWGVFETMQQQRGQGQQPAAPGPPPGPAAAPQAPGRSAPPPIPGAEPSAATEAAVPEGALRIVRLMLSAARADGTLTDRERERILSKAGEAGVREVVARELANPTPLPAIVGGISDRKQREDLYVLAFGIVRADESVTGAERIYLAQLAARLDLDAATTVRLEDEAAARIARTPEA